MSRKRGRRQNPYKGPDPHTRAAKKKGFAARSVFKLEEIDRRTRILKPGMHVLDLGAAPGSWSAYASQKIGKNGVLVAIDLQPLTQSLRPNAHVIEGDAYDEANVTDGLMVQRDLLARFDAVNEELTAGGSPDEMELISELSEVTERLEALNCWSIESDVSAAMKALNCPPRDAMPGTLSGG